MNVHVTRAHRTASETGIPSSRGILCPHTSGDNNNKQPRYWLMYVLHCNFYHCFVVYSFHLKKEKVYYKTICVSLILCKYTPWFKLQGSSTNLILTQPLSWTRPVWARQCGMVQAEKGGQPTGGSENKNGVNLTKQKTLQIQQNQKDHDRSKVNKD